MSWSKYDIDVIDRATRQLGNVGLLSAADSAQLTARLTNGKVELFVHDQQTDKLLEEIALTLVDIREGLA